MGTPQPVDKFNVPIGSERVVSVRRVQKAPTNPLTVNTHIPEGDILHERTTVHHKHRSEHRHNTRSSQISSSRKSKKRDQRSVKAWSTVIPANNNEQEKVISCLEMNIDGSNAASHNIPVHSDGDQVHISTSRSKLSKSHRKSRSGELGSWLSLKSENTEHAKWRYSNIFAPESPKSHRTKTRSHKSRAVSIQPSPGSQIWSPFIPVPITYYPSLPYLPCPRCSGDFPEMPIRSYSHDAFGTQHFSNVAYTASAIPYPPQSSENILQPPRTASFLPHHHHHHHHVNSQQFGRVGMTRSRTMPPGPPVGRVYSQGTVLSTSVDDLADAENEDYERMIMEIEYAVADEDDMNNRMSSKTLQFIVKLARQLCKLDDLEEMAKQLKLVLDKKFGEKWQVVVGDDSFGSYLASLPGALANFRINDFVFLIWQT